MEILFQRVSGKYQKRINPRRKIPPQTSDLREGKVIKSNSNSILVIHFAL